MKLFILFLLLSGLPICAMEMQMLSQEQGSIDPNQRGLVMSHQGMCCGDYTCLCNGDEDKGVITCCSCKVASWVRRIGNNACCFLLGCTYEDGRCIVCFPCWCVGDDD